jgi:hypothetical protein
MRIRIQLFKLIRTRPATLVKTENLVICLIGKNGADLALFEKARQQLVTVRS